MHCACRKKKAPESFKMFYKKMLDRCSQVISFLSPLKESDTTAETQILKEENDLQAIIRDQVSLAAFMRPCDD